MDAKITYLPVSVGPDADDIAISDRQYHVRKGPSPRTWGAMILGVVLLIITAFTVRWFNSPIIYGCGMTPNEARANGCYFDIMIGAWIPEPCAEKEFSDAWSAGEEGLWYHDSNLTQPFATSELRKGDHEIAYTRGNFHLKHCLYMWERTLRNIMNNGMLDDEAVSLVHATHCTGLFRGITPLRPLTPEDPIVPASSLYVQDEIPGDDAAVWLMKVERRTRLEFTESVTDYPFCQKPRWSGWSRLIVPEEL